MPSKVWLYSYYIIKNIIKEILYREFMQDRRHHNTILSNFELEITQNAIFQPAKLMNRIYGNDYEFLQENLCSKTL